MPDSLTLALPVSAIGALLRKLMPPVINFGSATQRAKAEDESFWHIPVQLYPCLWKRIGPASMPNCQVYLDRYEGGIHKEAILLCWGDQQFHSPREYELLRKDHISLVPVAWRSEKGDDRNGYFTGARFFKEPPQLVYPISNDRAKHRFRLRVKSGSFSRTSPHTYMARCPKGVGNGHFVVEIEYEGEGTQG